MKVKDILETSFSTILDILNICEKRTTVWIESTFKDKQLTEVGAKLTFYYFTFIFVLFGWKLPSLLNKDLNEVGDFLAGIFGPVAFFWLIIGYLMQNKELKNNNISAKEAQNLARDQLVFQKKIKRNEIIKDHNLVQPHLKIKVNESSKEMILDDTVIITVDIKNSGEMIYDFSFIDNKHHIYTNGDLDIIDRNETKTFEIEIPKSLFENGYKKYVLTGEFLDKRHNLQKTPISIKSHYRESFENSNKHRISINITSTRKLEDDFNDN